MSRQSQIEGNMADKKNRKFADASASLAQAQKDSAKWGSWRGVAEKMPEAVHDTVGNAAKKVKKILAELLNPLQHHSSMPGSSAGAASARAGGLPPTG